MSHTTLDYSAFLEAERTRIDEILRGITAECVADLPEELREPVAYALSTEGKRLRPILAILGWSAANPDRDVPDALYRLACAVEIIHTYSLVHDDLPCMDDDDMRRGRPTVHRVFGLREATLAGATLLPIAVSVLDENGRALGLPAETRGRLVIELARAAGAEGMVGGQLMDLEAEGEEIDGATLEAIHRLKTGALLTCSLRIGAIAGGADAALLQDLTGYGEALGLAFQIADDLLDVEGDSADLGKTAGRDEALFKASYPALYGVEDAREMARSRVAEAHAALKDRELPHLDSIADYVIQRRR